ncbi:MAG: 3-isopropylmalate dehydratase small subunit [Candidatus Marinimicrobia bacterium]|nr:3-isopropylmalate dehydratase small subunit [Candidatus Neomarinimicrobiota bacterium]
MQGKAIVYKRDHINTDEIIPARYLNTDKEKELAEHAMEDLDKNFLDKIEPGDWVIAGKDFGCGSSREHAVWALRGAGVQGVIADSFARIFYRNCLDNGFLALEIEAATNNINNGDELKIDIDNGKIIDLSQDKKMEFKPLPDFAQKMLDLGGLMNYIKNEYNFD